MTVTRRIDAVSALRMLAILCAAALVAAALPLGGIASADEHDNGDDGNDVDVEINGEVVLSPADPEAELIESLRFAGQQRFATAALVALETWGQSDRAILARHDEWPDALAGGYLAGVLGAPVLLVSQNNLQPDTLNALEALGVSEITILGGTQAISEASQTSLEEDHGYEVDRIAGATRFETAAMIASEGDAGEIDGERTAFVATGINFADALTAGPLAYDGNFPILLTPSQSLHPATEQALMDLEIDRVVLLGGTNAISAGVEDAIIDAIDGDDDSVERLSGTTRVETAAEVAVFAITELGFSPFQHGWARGNDFADALTIGPRLGEVGGPLLLIPTPTLVDSGEGTNAALAEEVRCLTAMIDIAGGTAAVSQEAEDTLRALLACPEAPLLFSLDADPESDFAGEWIDLTATVWTNTGAPVEGGEVTFDVSTVTPEVGPTVEFREADGEPEAEGPITVETDENGEAMVQVSSDEFAWVEIEAMHEREDEVVLSDTVEVAFTPVDGDFTFNNVALSSEAEVGDNTAVDEDPPFTGTAWVHADPASGLVCWYLVVDDPIDDQDPGSFAAWAEGTGIPGSHIHEGDVDTAGPVVVVLGTVSDESPHTSQGCALADTDVLDDIVDTPADYYVNIHTDLFPGGIVRGQLG